MACKCVNQDGTLSAKCYGICKIDVIKEQKLQQQREPLDGFAELIMGQVNKLIDNRLNEFQIKVDQELNRHYRESFMEGFKQGFRFAREEDERY